MPTADKLNDMRRQILEGAEPSRDELRGAIMSLVGERIEAATAVAAKGKKAKSTPVANLDDLLG